MPTTAKHKQNDLLDSAEQVILCAAIMSIDAAVQTAAVAFVRRHTSWVTKQAEEIACAIRAIAEDGAEVEPVGLWERGISPSVLGALLGHNNDCGATTFVSLERAIGLLDDAEIEHSIRDTGLAISCGALTATQGLDRIQQAAALRTPKHGIEFEDLTSWRDLAAQEPPWLFDQRIPDKVAIVFAAAGGTGKTALARAITLSGITGKTIFPSFRPSRTMTVLVLNAEDSTPIYLRGLVATAKLHGISDADLDDALRHRLLLRSLAPLRFLRIDNSGTVAESPDYAELLATVRRLKPDLLIVDTFRKHFGGRTEKDNDEAGVFMEACSRLASEGDTAIIVLTHTSKASARDTEANGGDVRGASAILDESRCGYSLKGTNGGFSMHCVKMSYGPKPTPADFRFDGAGLVEATQNRDPLAVAGTLRQWLLDNPKMLITRIGITGRKGNAALAHDHIVQAHPWASADKIADAIAAGIRAGLLNEIERKKGNGQEIAALMPGTAEFEEVDDDDTPF